MKVLLLGATGNMGLRLIASLLSHNHTVVAYVRSSSKLQSLIPSSVSSRLAAIVQGDATDSNAIKRAILDNNCDAVINTAGLAAMAPWGSSDLPKIFRSVFNAVLEAGSERGKPLRAWFMAGLTVLMYPGTETMLSNYIPIFLEHRQDYALFQTLPKSTTGASSINWSMLCPGFMVPESPSISAPISSKASVATSSRQRLLASATSPPAWIPHPWLEYIPFLGRMTSCGLNAGRYETSLEQAADFIAQDLEKGDKSEYVCKTVGIIDPSKA